MANANRKNGEWSLSEVLGITDDEEAKIAQRVFLKIPNQKNTEDFVLESLKSAVFSGVPIEIIVEIWYTAQIVANFNWMNDLLNVTDRVKKESYKLGLAEELVVEEKQRRESEGKVEQNNNSSMGQ
jgi:hypothetical protein